MNAASNTIVHAALNTSRASGSFRLIARHELKVLIADYTLPFVCLLLTALMLYGLYTGVVSTRERDRVVAELVDQQREKDRENLESWHRVMSGEEIPKPFSNPVDPASIGGKMGAQYAALPTTPLAPVAAGQSDMLADYYRVTYQSRDTFMYDSEVENPWKLLTGRLDLAFVLVYLLPLLIFGVSYNLLSCERDQGTLRMLLSQPLTLTQLVMAKVAVRALIVTAIAVLVPALTLLLLRPELMSATGGSLLGLWALMVVGYAVFWFALSVLINTLGRSSAANALMLIGIWVLLVMVIPVAMNLAFAHLSPAPSRSELATRTRLVQIDGLNRYSDLLSADYRYTGAGGASALLPKDGRLEVSPRMRAFYLMSEDIDRNVQPLLDEFDAKLAGQQALVDKFGFLSPAVSLNEGMAAVAGNGSRRYLNFQKQVIDFHEQWKSYFMPKVLNGIAITERDFSAHPRWTWREQTLGSVTGDAVLRAAQLVLLAVALSVLALMRLGRYRVV